jgi:hypothetical protein
MKQLDYGYSEESGEAYYGVTQLQPCVTEAGH